MTLPQKILFTAVFTVYWFIFYGVVYYALAWWDPALLEIPEHLGKNYVLSALGIFTLLVLLAYVGAAYVVLGRMPGTDPGRNSARDRGPSPGDRLRKSRRLFGGRGQNPAPAATTPRPAGRSGGHKARPTGRGTPPPGRKTSPPKKKDGPRPGAAR
ncbi:MAG: hypothetical protein RIF32_02130 [Leptospirales bacterium]